MSGAGRKPPVLEVQVMFEQHRLAAARLEAAYAQIVPTLTRRVRGGPVAGGASVPAEQELRHG